MSSEKKKRVRSLPGKSKKLASYIQPMLAKESVAAFIDKNLIYEIKMDCYSGIAENDHQKLFLYYR